MSQSMSKNDAEQNMDNQQTSSSYLCSLLFDIAVEAILILKNGQIIDANKSAAKMFGYPQAELLGKTVLDVSLATQPNGDDSGKRLGQHLAAVLAGETVSFEWVIQHLDGDSCWTDVNISSLSVEGEQYIRVSFHDISRYKEQMKPDTAEVELLRFIVDTLPEHIYVKDTQGRFVFGNLATAQSLGASRTSDIVGKTDFDFSPAEFAEQFQADDQAFFTGDQATLYKEDEILDQITNEPRWVATRKILWRNEQDQILGLVGINHDITETKLAEQELNRLTRVIEATSDFVGISDAEGIPIYVNEAGRAMVGMSNDLDVTKIHIADFYPEAVIPKVVEEYLPATVTEGIWRGENVFQRQDGTEVQISQVIIAHKSEDGTVHNFSTIARDITERKQLEAQIRQSLKRRESQVQTSTEIAQRIASAPDLTELFIQVVDLVQQRFGYYHAHIYTIEQNTLIMQAGSGEIGRQLKAAGHLIPLPAKRSIVARSARSGQPILVSDVGQEAGWLPNKLLPHTKAELAVPIKLGEQVLGVLDVQNDVVDSLTKEDQLVLLGLSGQIAIAMESTRLLNDTKNSADFFNAVINALPDPLFVKDNDHRWLVLNDTMSQWMGRPATEFLGKSDYDVFPLEEADIFWEQDNKVFASEGAIENEEFFTDATGFKRTISTKKITHQLPNGERILIGTIRDITERKKVEETLLNRDEQFKNTIGQLPMAVAISRLGDGSLLYLNKAFGQFFGGPIEDLVELKAPDFYYDPADREKVLDEFREKGSVEVLEIQFKRVDGQPLPSTISIYPIEFMGESVFLSVFYDLSERKRTEDALRQSEAQLRAMLEDLPIPVTISNEMGNLRYFNNAFSDLFGGSHSELMARNTSSFYVNQADRTPILEAFSQDGFVENLEINFKKVNEEIFSAALSLRPIIYENESLYLAAFYDLTERKQTEAVLQENELLLTRAQQMAKLGVWTWEPATDTITWTDPLFDMLGVPKDTALSFDTYMGVVHPDDQERVGIVIQEAMASEKYTFEYQFKLADGLGLVSVLGEIFRDEAGQPIRLVGVAQDITERKQAEAELEARVNELDNLQRLMSREGWQAFQTTRFDAALGYQYDQTTVHPINGAEGEDSKNSNTAPATSLDTDNTLTKTLSVRGEIIGKIGIQDDPDQPLLDEDEAFLTAITDQVAEALERARLLEQTQKRAVELETVIEVGTVASSTFDANYLMQTVVDLTKTRFGFYHVHIYRLDETEQTLVLAAGAGEIGQQMISQGHEIPLTHQASIVVQTAKTRQGVIINDVQQAPHFLPHPLLPETKSEMAIPMLVGDQVFGVLDIQSDVAGRFSEEDRRIHTILAAQVAAVLQNVGLFEQTEQALAETEILYRVGTQLNGITDIADVLQIIAFPEIAPNIASISLMLIESDALGQPEWARLASASIYGEPTNDILAMPIGTRIQLSDFALSRLWLANSERVTLISDTDQDEQLDDELREICKQASVHSMAILPLVLGVRWVGLINMIWTQPHQFTDRNQRLFQAISGQTTVVVNNWLLLRQAEERAQQLEQVAQLETALSQVTDEANMLNFLGETFDLTHWEKMTLNYLDVDEQNNSLVSGYLAATWENGVVNQDDARLGQVYDVQSLPFYDLWRHTATRILVITDVQNDSRLSPVMRQIAQRQNIQAAIILPLYSTGRWQGMLLLSSSEPREIALSEQDLFQQVLESLSVLVTGRRAYLVQQTALAETEILYRISQRINEANDLEGILTAVVTSAPLGATNRALLALLEQNDLGQAESLTVAAAWYSGQGVAPMPIGTSYPRELLNTETIFLTKTPLFLENVQYDERVDVNTLEVIKAYNTLAIAILPLWIGARQVGVLIFEAEDLYRFSEQEMRIYASFSQQVAVAVDNQRLLSETRLALDEVERTQQRYTLQAWDTYQVSQPVQSHEVVRDDVAENGKLVALTNSTDLIVPLKVQDVEIGVVGLQETDHTREWLPEEIALIEAVSYEIAQSAEKLRLLDETQRRAAREQRVNEISDKIQGAQTLEEALKIAVQEVGISLNSPQTRIQLGIE